MPDVIALKRYAMCQSWIAGDVTGLAIAGDVTKEWGPLCRDDVFFSSFFCFRVCTVLPDRQVVEKIPQRALCDRGLPASDGKTKPRREV
ncbi:UNVERIFIED_CONTAM: hypothetical protein FKN15_071187 [Acipenser sinensis]